MVLVVPSVRAALAHSLPSVLEGIVAPAVVFYVALYLGGFMGAVYAALGFSLVALVRRIVTSRRVPGTLWMSFGLLAARTVVSLLTGSPMLYFIQPTLGTCVVGLAFLISAGSRRPLIERLASDFCPFSPELLARAGMRRFFTRISLLWAVVMLSNAGVVLGLLVTSSLRAFVIERTIVTWGLSIVAIALSTLAFVRMLRREGIHLRFSPLP